ncbi:MAG: permease prefix domain 1-containing protein [Chloroflexota bacterium]
MNADLELSRWLDAATRGLPCESRGWIRDELLAHYEDAVQEALQRGGSPAEAHVAALAELGSASTIQHDLSETHLAERRYRFAAAASLIFPLAILAHLALIARGSSGLDVILYDLLLLLPLLYVLRNLHTLFVLRFNLHVERRLGLIALGLLAMTLPEIAMQAIWLALTHGIGGEVSALGVTLLNGLMLVDLLGAVLLGIGFVWLVEALLRLKSRGLWMLRPFCYVALIAGYALALTSAASVIGRQDLFNTTWTAALILGVIMHALWMLMFTRAAQPDQPAFAA